MLDNPKRRKRSKRSSSSQAEVDSSVSDPQITNQPEAEEENSVRPSTSTPNAFNNINEIRSEIINSERAADSESDYWDDSHNWLDEYSPEYANFLGSYE